MKPGIDIYGIEVLPVKKMSQISMELAERLELPEEALLGEVKLTAIGARRILVENHRGVLDYGEDRLLLSLGRGKLIISGSGLRLKAMNRREVLVTGRIQSLEWE